MTELKFVNEMPPGGLKLFSESYIVLDNKEQCELLTKPKGYKIGFGGFEPWRSSQ